MLKRSPGEEREPKPVQINTSPDAYEDNTSQIVEMAAEQFADLLWRHWLYMKKLKNKGSKNPDS